MITSHTPKRGPTLRAFLLLSLLLFPGLVRGEEAAPPEALPDSSGLTARALLIPTRESVLSAEIAARIRSIQVDVGDRFNKGQTLVKLDCGMYTARLAKAEAELAEAEKTLEVNRRIEELGSISELEVAVAAAHVDKARAEADLHRIQTGRCIICAPFGGRVVDRIAQPHEYVDTGRPLLKILDNRNLDLQIHVPSGWLKWIRPSIRFQVHIDEVDRDYAARVLSLIHI